MKHKDLLLIGVVGVAIVLLFVQGELTGMPLIQPRIPVYGVRPNPTLAVVACCDSCNDISSCYTTTQGRTVLKLPPCNAWEVRCKL
ncbi:hypothetical protein HY486_03290 [Candidatus Woesearchaeota archaeon]|nr:hypothetical protein [Candidatus Woesearchaeota archaeon]